MTIVRMLEPGSRYWPWFSLSWSKGNLLLKNNPSRKNPEIQKTWIEFLDAKMALPAPGNAYWKINRTLLFFIFQAIQTRVETISGTIQVGSQVNLHKDETKPKTEVRIGQTKYIFLFKKTTEFIVCYKMLIKYWILAFFIVSIKKKIPLN